MRKRFFSFPKTSRPALGVTHTPVPGVMGGFSSMGKWLGCEIDICTGFRNEGSCTFSSPIYFHGMDRENFTFFGFFTYYYYYYYYTIGISLVTGLFFPVHLLNQRWSPPLWVQASHCSTFRIMCGVSSIAVFCSESVECFPGTASLSF